MTGSTAVRGPRFRWKSYARAWIGISMLVGWPIVVVSGVLLWLADPGRQSGQQELFLDLTKSEWGDIHWWVSVAVVLITLVHVVIDFKALKGALRYLVSFHRGTNAQPRGRRPSAGASAD
ncbi:MAG: DUF4405 domain-containing protein [Chloroflexi bacterium]|nr:DUF4405 domain-containing protein [Chloroflexota bacterium]